jgi:hypothetical protein
VEIREERQASPVADAVGALIAADKAKAVALATYPGGTVNRVLKLSDGSYAVHMIKIRWPHHVFVSPSCQVRGAIG